MNRVVQVRRIAEAKKRVRDHSAVRLAEAERNLASAREERTEAEADRDAGRRQARARLDTPVTAHDLLHMEELERLHEQKVAAHRQLEGAVEKISMRVRGELERDARAHQRLDAVRERMEQEAFRTGERREQRVQDELAGRPRGAKHD